MTYFWIALAALVVAFFAIIIIRALRFTPRAATPVAPTVVEIDEQAAIAHITAACAPLASARLNWDLKPLEPA